MSVQVKISTNPEDPANGPNLVVVHEGFIDENGNDGEPVDGAMGNAVATSTPLSSQSVVFVPDLDQDQNGTARITRAKYLSTCSSCLLIFLSLI